MRQRNAARLIPIATTDVAWHVARADDSGRRSWSMRRRSCGSGKRGRLRRGRCGAAKRSWSARYAIRHSVIARAQHLARVTTPTPVPRPASHVGAKAHACAYEDSDMRCVRMPCAALDLCACISLRGIRVVCRRGPAVVVPAALTRRAPCAVARLCHRRRSGRAACGCGGCCRKGRRIRGRAEFDRRRASQSGPARTAQAYGGI